MDKTILSYALLRTFYDNDKSFFDTLSPLILSVLKEGQEYSLTEIKKLLKDEFNQNIPLNVLKMLSKRMKKQKYIDIFNKNDNRVYIITDKGLNRKNNISIEPVRRNVNLLLKTAVEYFEKRKMSISEKEVYKLLLNFINSNIEYFIETLSREYKFDYDRININKNKEKILFDFFSEIQKNNNTCFDIFNQIVFGSLISTLLSLDEIDFTNNINRKFKKTTIYLDSNIIFSLLNLHSEEINEAVKELLALLKSNNFEIRFFDFTLNQVKMYLLNYVNEEKKYLTRLRVNSIYSKLKNYNYTKNDLLYFIKNLENELLNMNIKKETTNININSIYDTDFYNNFNDKDKYLYNKLCSIKEDAPPKRCFA